MTLLYIYGHLLALLEKDYERDLSLADLEIFPAIFVEFSSS